RCFVVAVEPANGYRGEDAPGEQPHQMQGPVEISGKLVVVLGDALTEKPKEVFVDEVEPEEVIVANAGQQVPRRGDRKENQESCRNPKFSPASPVARDRHKNHNRCTDNNQWQKTFSENCHCKTRIASEPAPCLPRFQHCEETVKDQGDEEA